MVKEKTNSVRTYDADGFRRRAACLCIRDERGLGDQEVLLVSGSRDPSSWIVPGGGIEPTEDTATAAVRELEEEAGARGTIIRCLGVFENMERKTRTSVYAMSLTELLDDWDDAKIMGRRRHWFSFADASAQLAIYKPVQQAYLLELMDQKLHKSDKVT
ncbi:hypothetical protein CAPTEDRAFT_149402 [Capitella teleta]|uniref:diphosphoinositol-polyphosphate diphosphatase n=1 Tax=Capitella teleta TaxID=283909 RepID=R7V311_CAPTE|nr:hypothetical protein CAPTEDRAFT_149402 [Capitella teleta]|eukprot:ELU13228.1 hypothetical protein CAPTEDRAFT_149402 [Capitella teleta]